MRSLVGRVRSAISCSPRARQAVTSLALGRPFLHFVLTRVQGPAVAPGWRGIDSHPFEARGTVITLRVQGVAVTSAKSRSVDVSEVCRAS